MEFGLWDKTYLTLIALMPNDDEPYNVHPTGSLEQPDSITEWIEIITEYPNDYIPEHPELLGFSTITMGEDGRLRRQFPNADFSSDNLRNLMLDKIDRDLEFALAPTNQYVINALELDEDVPVRIDEARTSVRALATTVKQQVETSEETLLPSIEWDFPPTERIQRWHPPTSGEIGVQ